jgi:gamma-glutamyltranspeptidase/glutathione hydrolase
MRHIAVLAVLLLLCAVVLPISGQMPQSGDDRAAARSMVITRGGIVASDQVLASQAAAEILARGGSAADAAIAANAAMGVLEPMMNGIGGDLFAIEYDAKTGALSGLNASGWAPEKMTPELFRQKGLTRVPERGIDSVTVPGAVAGWAALHAKFGKLPWKELFRPAIYYAQNGFPVTQFVAAWWKDNAPILERYGATLYLPGG